MKMKIDGPGSENLTRENKIAIVRQLLNSPLAGLVLGGLMNEGIDFGDGEVITDGIMRDESDLMPDVYGDIGGEDLMPGMLGMLGVPRLGDMEDIMSILDDDKDSISDKSLNSLSGLIELPMHMSDEDLPTPEKCDKCENTNCLMHSLGALVSELQDLLVGDQKKDEQPLMRYCGELDCSGHPFSMKMIGDMCFGCETSDCPKHSEYTGEDELDCEFNCKFGGCPNHPEYVKGFLSTGPGADVKDETEHVGVK